MTKQEWDKLYVGERAWRLNQIISHMNDEEAYYSGWLYIWPDGETFEECMSDFDNEESYKELEDSFKIYYSFEESHEAGLYSSKGIRKQIVDDAHFWDEQLGLPPIEVLSKCY